MVNTEPTNVNPKYRGLLNMEFITMIAWGAVGLGLFNVGLALFVYLKPQVTEITYKNDL